MFRIKRPSMAPACVELVFTHATCQYIPQYVGCEALSAVTLCAHVFVSDFGLDQNEHTRHAF